MRVKHDLCKALSVSVVGDTAALLVDILAAELARRYELPAELVEFHRLSPGDFLLNLPDAPAAVHVYNGGRPIQLPSFTISCKWWSRLKGASGAMLPTLLDISLVGVPAHVWELETVEHLLDEWC
jgi:hypothetical protein